MIYLGDSDKGTKGTQMIDPKMPKQLAKLAYHSPQMNEWGNLQEITRGGGTGDKYDQNRTDFFGSVAVSGAPPPPRDSTGDNSVLPDSSHPWQKHFHPPTP